MQNRTFSMPWVALALSTTLLLTACGGGRSSTENFTANMTANYQIIAPGDGRVYANAYLQSNEPIALVENEQLRLLTGEIDELENDTLFDALAQWDEEHPRFQRAPEAGAPRPLTFVEPNFRDDSSSTPPLSDYYFASTEETQERQYHIGFYRRAHESAVDSTVTLPKPFQLYAPIADDIYSVGNDYLNLEWSTSESSDTVRIEVSSDCENELLYQQTLDNDPGLYSIPPETMTLSATNSSACPAQVSVYKYRTERVDPLFRKGLITAYQVRRRSIKLMY